MTIVYAPQATSTDTLRTPAAPMILLDTHVVAEPMRLQGDLQVLAGLDAQAIDTLDLSTITLAELHFGIAALPAGQRRETLRRSLEERVLPLFEGRILPLDEPGARASADLRAAARARGLAVGVADGYIAGIAAAEGLAVATRDVSPFVAAGVTVIDPWAAAG